MKYVVCFHASRGSRMGEVLSQMLKIWVHPARLLIETIKPTFLLEATCLLSLILFIAYISFHICKFHPYNVLLLFLLINLCCTVYWLVHAQGNHSMGPNHKCVPGVCQRITELYLPRQIIVPLATCDIIRWLCRSCVISLWGFRIFLCCNTDDCCIFFSQCFITL